MEDREKTRYNHWNSEETKVLVELLVEEIKRIWCEKLYKEYQNSIKYWKTLYQSYVDLQRNSSGFGWDYKTKRFTVSEEVWQRYLKVFFSVLHSLYYRNS